jgi:alpha-beta hydrolase superfamily lysophospholipase
MASEAGVMEPFKLNASDGKRLQLYRWLPQAAPLATVQIAHGMGEHAAGYDHFARVLTRAGYAVYADDHRGHGRTADPELMGDMGPDGWNCVIRDAADITDYVRTTHPGLPHVLFGHSMGAMLAKQFLYRFGARVDAVVLSGSPGFLGGFRAWLSHNLARVERWRLGPTAASPLMQKLLFGGNNKAFDGPGATGFEWLSRDYAQVAGYATDPLCGFVLRTGSLCDLFAGAREARKTENILQIPRSLPLYVFSGSDDPVHAAERNLKRLIAAYRDHLERVDYRLYPGGRHEMLNEINRDEVIQDVVGWLDSVVLSRARGTPVTASSPN